MTSFIQLAVNVPSIAGVFDYAVPDHLAIERDVEDATFAGHDGHFFKLLDEGREQLGGRPGRPHQPAALGAVFDFQPW